MKKKLIYYIDDEELNNELFQDSFESEYIKIMTFLEPKKVIEAVQREKPDIFLSTIDFQK